MTGRVRIWNSDANTRAVNQLGYRNPLFNRFGNGARRFYPARLSVPSARKGQIAGVHGNIRIQFVGAAVPFKVDAKPILCFVYDAPKKPVHLIPVRKVWRGDGGVRNIIFPAGRSLSVENQLSVGRHRISSLSNNENLIPQICLRRGSVFYRVSTNDVRAVRRPIVKGISGGQRPVYVFVLKLYMVLRYMIVR